jgi:hypothetical protein
VQLLLAALLLAALLLAALLLAVIRMAVIRMAVIRMAVMARPTGRTSGHYRSALHWGTHARPASMSAILTRAFVYPHLVGLVILQAAKQQPHQAKRRLLRLLGMLRMMPCSGMTTTLTMATHQAGTIMLHTMRCCVTGATTTGVMGVEAMVV